MKTLYKDIQLKKNSQLISEATDVFTGYIDSDFKDLQDIGTTRNEPFAICELEKDSTFKQMFTDPENQWLSQSEVIEICKTHKDKLNTDSRANLFLLKNGTDFFAAHVYVYDRAKLRAHVYEFSHGRVWGGGFRPRVFYPQRSLETLEQTLRPLNSLTLPELLTVNGVHYKRVK